MRKAESEKEAREERKGYWRRRCSKRSRERMLSHRLIHRKRLKKEVGRGLLLKDVSGGGTEGNAISQ